MTCEKIYCNAVIDTDIQPVSTPVEPVSLDDMKEYMKVDYDDEDSFIQSLITEAREWVERRCGISVIPKNITAILQVLNSQELPYGPINTDIDITVSGNKNYTLTGIKFISLNGYGIYEVNYNAGYTSVPEGIIGAIKSYVAYCFENRGDNLNIESSDNLFAKEARYKSSFFKRNIGF